MSFISFSSRCLLSGYFVADGLQAAINPEPLVDDAEPYATKFTSYVDQLLPADIARRVPRTTTTLVRLHGIVQTVGALMMATGIFRRLGATMVAVSYVPKVLMARPTSSDDILPFTRELALLGAAMVESVNKGKHCTRGQKKKLRKAAKSASVSNAKAAVEVSKKEHGRQTEALRRILSSATS